MIGEKAVGDCSDPKKELVRLSFMMAVPLMLMAINILIDITHTTELGEDAVAAISISTPVYWIMMAGSSVMSQVLASKIRKDLSEGDRAAAEKTTSDMMYLGIVVAIVFGILAYFAYVFLISGFLEEGIVDLSLEYLLPFLVLFFTFPSYAVISGLLSAEGSYKRYTAVTMVVVLTNIIYDDVFLHELHMGIFGIGLGTILGIYTGAVVGLLFYRRRSGRMMICLMRPHFRDILGLAREIARKAVMPVMDAFVKYAALFAVIVCASVFQTLYYTIPMHIVSALASVGTAVQTATVLLTSKIPDLEDRIGFWIYAYKFCFVVMVAMAAVCFLVSDLLLDNLVHWEFKDWHQEYLGFSLFLFSFAMPFMGLRHINKHVIESVGKDGLGNRIIMLSMAVRIITYIAAAVWLDYPGIFYVVVQDYIVAGAGGSALLWWIQRKRRDLLAAGSDRGRTGPLQGIPRSGGGLAGTPPARGARGTC